MYRVGFLAGTVAKFVSSGRVSFMFFCLFCVCALNFIVFQNLLGVLFFPGKTPYWCTFTLFYIRVCHRYCNTRRIFNCIQVTWCLILLFFNNNIFYSVLSSKLSSILIFFVLVLGNGIIPVLFVRTPFSSFIFCFSFCCVVFSRPCPLDKI